MTSLRILCTNPDNSVAVVVPSPRCIIRLQWGEPLWTHYSRWRLGLHAFLFQRFPLQWPLFLLRGEIPSEIARAWEIEKFLRDPGWRPERRDRKQLAAKWIDALTLGGYGEREAVALIGEVTAPPYATALEIVDASEIPSDRTHRDAWRRSKNGGPIWIDEEKALAIDEARMWAAYERPAVSDSSARRLPRQSAILAR